MKYNIDDIIIIGEYSFSVNSGFLKLKTKNLIFFTHTNKNINEFFHSIGITREHLIEKFNLGRTGSFPTFDVGKGDEVIDYLLSCIKEPYYEVY